MTASDTYSHLKDLQDAWEILDRLVRKLIDEKEPIIARQKLYGAQIYLERQQKLELEELEES